MVTALPPQAIAALEFISFFDIEGFFLFVILLASVRVAFKYFIYFAYDVEEDESFDYDSHHDSYIDSINSQKEIDNQSSDPIGR